MAVGQIIKTVTISTKDEGEVRCADLWDLEKKQRYSVKSLSSAFQLKDIVKFEVEPGQSLWATVEEKLDSAPAGMTPLL
ncbi:MAG TPA: hypothetical protein PLO23_08780 [Alphaproteobacteria bacterium]|nr:hypothetical protein [Alphaproteobacteria bacterium]